MIEPESINLLALPSLSLSRRGELPETSAIYFAIDSLDQIQYIGRLQKPTIRGDEEKLTGSEPTKF